MAKFMLTRAIRGKCPPCLNKKDVPLFVVSGDVFNGRICAEHLHALASEEAQQEEKGHEVVPVNGQVS